MSPRAGKRPAKSPARASAALIAIHPNGGAKSEPADADADDRVDERLVEQAVAHLRNLVVVSQVQTAVAVGEYLMEKFYGSVEAARSQRPFKAASLRRLAERSGEFGMSASTLKYAVPTSLAVRDLGHTLAGRLGVSRVRALLPIQNATERKLLAETAASSDWTVDKVKSRVRQIKKPHPGGRPQSPAIDRILGQIARILDTGTSAGELRVHADELSPAEARRLLASVNRSQAALERIEKVVQRVATKGE